MYPRINQTWNPVCVGSSIEYKCIIPCCWTMEEYESVYNNESGLSPPPGTRNETLLNLTDPAWGGAFMHKKCGFPISGPTANCSDDGEIVQRDGQWLCQVDL